MRFSIAWELRLLGIWERSKATVDMTKLPILMC
jgi:hypothetical protein